MEMQPIVIMKYRQPKFLDRVQFSSSSSQVRYPSRGQAINVASSCAKAQNMERTVRRYCFVAGRASRKMALSTGRFPPTPKDQKAAKTPMAAKLGEPAAMRPHTAVIPIVRLNAHRRPNRSL